MSFQERSRIGLERLSKRRLHTFEEMRAQAQRVGERAATNKKKRKKLK